MFDTVECPYCEYENDMSEGLTDLSSSNKFDHECENCEKELERLTKKTIGCFGYDLKDHEPKTGEFNDYDTFFNYSMAIKRLGELEDTLEPKPLEEWHEDMGDCLWWFFPIQEAPYCGSPLDCNFPKYVTHFTKLIMPLSNQQSERCTCYN